MADRPLDFHLYRLIVVDEDTLEFMGRPIRGDGDIVAILERSVESEFDVTIEGPVNQHRFSVRDFVDYGPMGVSDAPMVGFTIARAVVQQYGPIVTEDAIITGTSTPDNPIATTANVIFYLERHIAAVAYNSALMDSHAWRNSLHDIFDHAATSLGIKSSLRLEPIPIDSEVLETFRSFTRLTRLRVHLKLPNPELSRHSVNLRNMMLNGGIRDFLQDMKGHDGLSQSPENLPYASAAMADQGYKSGEVTMEGERDGEPVKVVTGQTAARVSLEGERIREYVRGMSAITRTQEGHKLTKNLLEVIDRIFPKPTQEDEGQGPISQGTPRDGP
jgi:hypothetical protein